MSANRRPGGRSRTPGRGSQRAVARKPRWLLPAIGAGVVAVVAITFTILAVRGGEKADSTVVAAPTVSAAPTVAAAPSGDGELSQIKTNDFHSMAVSPADPNLLLYGHHGGVLRSTDGGRTWNKTNLTAETDDAMGMGFR